MNIEKFQFDNNFTLLDFLSNLVSKSSISADKFDIQNVYLILKKIKPNAMDILSEEQRMKIISSIQHLLGHYYKNKHFCKIALFFLNKLDCQHLKIDNILYSEFFTKILLYYHDIPTYKNDYNIDELFLQNKDFDYKISKELYGELRNNILKRLLCLKTFDEKNKLILIRLFEILPAEYLNDDEQLQKMILNSFQITLIFIYIFICFLTYY